MSSLLAISSGSLVTAIGQPGVTVCSHLRVKRGLRNLTDFWLFLFFFPPLDDDGFTIYLDDAEAKELVYDHAKSMNKLN